MHRFILGCVICAISLSAQATFIPGDGTDLRVYMGKYEVVRRPDFKFENATDAFHVGVLVGYVEAVAFSLEAEKVVCPPHIGLSSANYLDIVGRYLKKTPRTDKEFGASLIAAAFQEAFPCRR